MCTFLSQNGALWDICLVHCGIGEIGLLYETKAVFHGSMSGVTVKHTFGAYINAVWAMVRLRHRLSGVT